MIQQDGEGQGAGIPGNATPDLLVHLAHGQHGVSPPKPWPGHLSQEHELWIPEQIVNLDALSLEL